MNSLLTGRLENCLTNVYILVCVVTEKKDYSNFIFRLDNNNILIFSELY